MSVFTMKLGVGSTRTRQKIKKYARRLLQNEPSHKRAEGPKKNAYKS